MKKLLYFIPLLLGVLLTSCYDKDIEEINNRLDAIEGTQIVSLQGQIAAIKSTLPELEKADKELMGYIESLQGTATNLQKSINSTNTKIEELKAALQNEADTAKADVLAQLASLKSDFEAELAKINATIATLQAKDIELNQKIANLKSYVDNELSNSTSWASATFATLEQYSSLAVEIATIRESIVSINSTIGTLQSNINTKIETDIAAAVSTLNASIQQKVAEVTNGYTTAVGAAKEEITAAYTAAIASAISAAELSMKSWVSDQLSGYYTIAEVEGKLAVLQATISEGDKALQAEIDALAGLLASTKEEMTAAYNQAIAKAINENNGIIDGKIANEIAVVNEKILNIENRISLIEERLWAVEDALEQIKSLDIKFDNIDKACLAGASIYVGYVIVCGDTDTNIEVWGDGGWRAEVYPETTSKGKIMITAPNDATSGKVVVLVTSGTGGVKMKTLHIVEGVLTEILDTYEVAWWTCTLDISVTTNLNYAIKIPVEDQDWISLLETRAMIRTESLTFVVAENQEEIQRSVTIEIIGECGDILQQFDIIQMAAPSGGYIEFDDKYAKMVCVNKFDTNGDGEISFKEASKVTAIQSNFFGDYAGAILSFEELQYFTNLLEIPNRAFYQCANMERVKLPNNITTIGERAFYACSNLGVIAIPFEVISIEREAFENCTTLYDIQLSNTVTTIGVSSFAGCSNLSSIEIPNSVIYIGSNAFCECSNLSSVVLSEKISFIESGTFSRCVSLVDVVIPDNVTTIGDFAFQNCKKLSTIVLGKGVTDINSLALSYCPNLTRIYSKAINPPSVYNNAFTGSNSESTIYVPNESVWLYQTTKWKSFADYIVGYDFE